MSNRTCPGRILWGIMCKMGHLIYSCNSLVGTDGSCRHDFRYMFPVDIFCRIRLPYCWCMFPLHRQNILSAQLCFDNTLLGILCIFLILDFVNISQQGNQCKIHSQFVQLKVDISPRSILYTQYRFRSSMFHTNILKTKGPQAIVTVLSTVKMPMSWPNFKNFIDLFNFFCTDRFSKYVNIFRFFRDIKL